MDAPPPRPRPQPIPVTDADEHNYSSDSTSSASSAASFNTIRPSSREQAAPSSHWTNYFAEEFWLEKQLDESPPVTVSTKKVADEVNVFFETGWSKSPLFFLKTLANWGQNKEDHKSPEEPKNLEV